MRNVRVWKVCIMLEKRITILFQISRAFIGSNPDILQQYKESVALHTTP